MKRLKKYVFDYDYLGLTNSQGEIRTLWQEEALSQSIKLWIASFKGDAIRNPRRGGYVTRWLMKPMNTVDVDEIDMVIRNGIYEDFNPYLQILNLEIKPNYSQRYWEISLTVYSPDLKVSTEVTEKIKAGIS
jgi:hypothetical protein